MPSRYITVEADIDEFDDADILAAAARIVETRGRAMLLGGGPETPAETLFRLVSALATSIAAGDTAEALRRLDDLVGDNRALRDAIDLGRRRVR